MGQYPRCIDGSHREAKGKSASKCVFAFQKTEKGNRLNCGYETDLASIPRMFWRIIAPFELSIAAPLVHDYLYGNGGVAENQVLSREETDKLFLAIMEAEEVPWWRRKLAYRAVRMFAGFAWKERKGVI